MTAPALLRQALRDILMEEFSPPLDLSVSDIADRERVLSPESSNRPGNFETNFVPYLRGIQDALGDDNIAEVTFKKASQIAGTTAGENWLLTIMLYHPGPTLMAWPSEPSMKSWNTKRLDPMLRDSPRLAEMFPKSGRRETSDTQTYKGFPGGYLQLVTSRSTKQLKSTAARNLIAEEVDEWEGDVGGQGDPLSLLKARARTFRPYKLYKNSTPTLDGFSRIVAEYDSSSQGGFYVPCPHCGERQTLEWRGKDGGYRLLYDRNATGDLVPGSAKYLCSACGVLIGHEHKRAMVAQGEWRHRFPERIPFNCGFRINTLYSPFVTWDEMAREFIACGKDPAKLKVFINTWVGEPYTEDGLEVEATGLMARAEHYKAEVPDGVGVLVAGVDVQGDRLEAVCIGFGAREESWVIERALFEGEPAQWEVWEALDQWLLRPWTHESGLQLRIAAACVDAGYQAKQVHAFCDARKNRRILAIIGQEGRGRPILEAPDPRTKFKRASNKRPTHRVGVDAAKDIIMPRLNLKEVGPGFMHFPDTVDQVFFDQLTSEKLGTVYPKGRPVRTWRLLPNRRNEVLDMVVYAHAALNYLGLGVIQNLHLHAEAARKGPGAVAASSAAPAANRSRVRSSGIAA